MIRLALIAALALTASPALAAPKGCTGYGCAGQPSKANQRPRTTAVRPYVRRNGTYVQGTYRSKPAKH